MIPLHMTLAWVKSGKQCYGIFYPLRDHLLHNLADYVMGWNKYETESKYQIEE